MGTFISLILLLFFLASGLAAARLKLVRANIFLERAFSVALYLLLFSMGLRLGQSKEVLQNLSLVGSLAVTGAVFASAGSVMLHVLCRPLYRRIDHAGLYGRDRLRFRSPVSGSRRLSILLFNLKKPFILLVLVLVGTVVGFALPPVTVLRDGSVATWILYFLLFIIGVQMAGSGNSLKMALFQPSVLVVPLVTVLGTLAGSLGTLLFEGMTPGRALALGSGFGWYSLSGVLIADLGDPMLGAAAFLSNLLRETIAFLTVPLLVYTGRCESGIGIAGATSMDVTLPVIEDAWGPEVIPLAVGHGVILSFLVPFLVPLFMSLG